HQICRCECECVIAVYATNGDWLAIVWRQVNDVSCNFRPGGWGYPTDAGIHWTFPGVLQDGVFRSDPVTKSDEVGKFFYLSLQSTCPPQTFYFDNLCPSTNAANSWADQSPTEAPAAAIKDGLPTNKTNSRGK